MKKRKIIVTGLSGVVGQSLVSSLIPKYEVISLSRNPVELKLVRSIQCDITNSKELAKQLSQEKPVAILHLAAATHIDACESDRTNGKDGIVWRTNVDATHDLVEFSASTNTPMVMLSTECVFDGEKETYSEDDVPNPKNWYGETKLLGERFAIDSGGPISILRSVIAFGQAGGKTMLEKMLAQIKSGKEFSVVSDQRISPTHLPRIGKVIMLLLDKPKKGIFHMTPEDSLTPLEFATLLARQYGSDTHIIQPVTMVDFFGNKRAKLRLKNSCLSSRKSIQLLALRPHTVRGVLQTLDLSML